MKDLKISKELLSEVLNEKVEVVDIKTSIDDYSIPTNEIRYYPALSTGYKSINIYELVFKCQEWGDSKGYDICPKVDKNGNFRLLTDDNIIGLKIEDRFIFSEDIEPSINRIEAIIKACEWILKEIKDK